VLSVKHAGLAEVNGRYVAENATTAAVSFRHEAGRWYVGLGLPALVGMEGGQGSRKVVFDINSSSDTWCIYSRPDWEVVYTAPRTSTSGDEVVQPPRVGWAAVEGLAAKSKSAPIVVVNGDGNDPPLCQRSDDVTSVGRGAVPKQQQHVNSDGEHGGGHGSGGNGLNMSQASLEARPVAGSANSTLRIDCLDLSDENTESHGGFDPGATKRFEATRTSSDFGDGGSGSEDNSDNEDGSSSTSPTSTPSAASRSALQPWSGALHGGSDWGDELGPTAVGYDDSLALGADELFENADTAAADPDQSKRVSFLDHTEFVEVDHSGLSSNGGWTDGNDAFGPTLVSVSVGDATLGDTALASPEVDELDYLEFCFRLTEEVSAHGLLDRQAIEHLFEHHIAQELMPHHTLRREDGSVREPLDQMKMRLVVEDLLVKMRVE
jgi:hypothetical protein